MSIAPTSTVSSVLESARTALALVSQCDHTWCALVLEKAKRFARKCVITSAPFVSRLPLRFDKFLKSTKPSSLQQTYGGKRRRSVGVTIACAVKCFADVYSLRSPGVHMKAAVECLSSRGIAAEKKK